MGPSGSPEAASRQTLRGVVQYVNARCALRNQHLEIIDFRSYVFNPDRKGIDHLAPAGIKPPLPLAMVGLGQRDSLGVVENSGFRESARVSKVYTDGTGLVSSGVVTFSRCGDRYVTRNSVR